MSEKNNNSNFVLKNIKLDNDLIIEELDLSKKINLIYAKNGTCKTALFRNLKNIKSDSLKEHHLIFYSYLDLLRNSFDYKNYLKKMNKYNNTSSVIENMICKNSKYISKTRDILGPILCKELIGYIDNHPFKYNDNASSLECFIDDIYECLLKNSKNFSNEKINYFFDNLYAYKNYFYINDNNILNIRDLLVTIDQKNDIISRMEYENIKQIEIIECDIEDAKKSNKKIELIEDDIRHYKDQIEKLKKDLMVKRNKYFLEINNIIFSKIADKYLLNLWKNHFNYKEESFEVFRIFLLFCYWFHYLVRLSKFNKISNLVQKLLSLNVKKIKSNFKKILKKYSENKYKTNIDNLENKFNMYFFDYIKFKNSKIIDSLFLNIDIPTINVFLKNKPIVNFEHLSDGEINAIMLVSLYLEIIWEEKECALIMDDATISLDKTNTLGFLNLLNDIAIERKTDMKIVLLSHDSYFINIAEKFLSRNFSNDIQAFTISNYLDKIEISKFTYINYKKFQYHDYFLIKEILKIYNNESDDEIFTFLHYDDNKNINDFFEKICIDVKVKNEIFEKLKIDDNSNIYDFFKKYSHIDNIDELPRKVFKLFYIRMTIEKLCWNKLEVKQIGNTLSMIEQSSLSKDEKKVLIKIYNNLPFFIHINFIDPSFLIDHDEKYIDNLIEQIKIFEDKNYV